MECITGQQPLIFDKKNKSTLNNRYRKSRLDEEPIDGLQENQQNQDEELRLARNTFGKLSSFFSGEEFKVVITEIKYLSQTWVDEFEKNIYKGKTLSELLNEGEI